jgi:ATP-dependent Clp protease ATP-binding subunit ClpC
VFERFTERARRVVVLAQDEAHRLQHGYIGTEHLLLGLIREEEGIAARVLTSHGVALQSAREEVARIVGRGDEPVTAQQMPFTPRSKKTLELSLREALSLNHNHIGTEHVLIALIHEGGGVALHILQRLGAPPEQVWESVYRRLGASEAPPLAPLSPPVGTALIRSSAGARDEGRRACRYDVWATVVAGAAIFAAGLLVGWLIWG